MKTEKIHTGKCMMKHIMVMAVLALGFGASAAIDGTNDYVI